MVEAFLPLSLQRHRALVERRAQASRQLHGIVVGPEVAEEQSRLLIEHMAMDCRHLDAVAAQRLDYRIDLFAGQNEVAGYRRLAATGGLEIDGLRDPHRTDRRELHAAFIDGVAARHGELVDAAIVLALGADDLVE